ncbi:hypothetical protein ABGB09_29590 [Streptomyces sp. B8F3]|uniref:hypothetical protein n=1 Tax=Streptomyces sp. B8F3 TaxID=3153573 RepID=UPI00325CC99A
MRFATTTEHNEMLHRQDHGTTMTFCETVAVYDVDQAEAGYGLLTGTRFMCPRCEQVYARRRRVAHGCAPQQAEYPLVRAAVAILAGSGHEPARITTDAPQEGSGFFVAGSVGNVVAIARAKDGALAGDAESDPIVAAYQRAMSLAGWHTGPITPFGFFAWQPQNITVLDPDQPTGHPED